MICFLSKKLTKAHVKYLESKLLTLAKEANTSNVENRNHPKPSKISDPDISDMQDFIDHIKLILPFVGIRSLDPSDRK